MAAVWLNPHETCSNLRLLSTLSRLLSSERPSLANPPAHVLDKSSQSVLAQSNQIHFPGPAEEEPRGEQQCQHD